ncbi:MAG: diacylglycerol kinase family lipid kinase [Treponema sp.]|jgi:YegS/Rv2252/BmrU family lipid kinase|nr:diacylglycerol kinase family lipid kinase [Treponema sp.]
MAAPDINKQSDINKQWIILNPAAGRGKALKQFPKIEKFLKKHSRNFEIIFTRRPGDALEIARNLPVAEGDVTVAAGGDGTCNEVVNGLLTRRPASGEAPLLGLLPAGRGNDFSSTPGIPEDPERALGIILRGKTRPLDAGFVRGGFFPEGRYFINGLGIGFDTKVGFEAAKMKFVRSGFAYALGALLAVIRYEDSPELRIRYGGREETLPAVIVSVMNGRRMGGSFFMGPGALLDDGELDICFVRHPPTRLKLVDIVLHYPKGTQAECEGVYTGRASAFHLQALKGGMAAHCDGETVCYDGRELEISCVPGALRLVGA